MKKWLLIPLLLLIIILGGCASATYTPPVYVPPPGVAENGKISEIVNKPFDETWSALIEYVSKTYYGIDNFEKESGLLTLSFGTQNPEQYITGGEWDYDSFQLKFKGDYVKFLKMYFGGKLNGKINIVVKPLSENKTQITANVRYVFSNKYGDTWIFESNTCAEEFISHPLLGTPKTRKICPTHKIESEILTAIKSLDEK